ncbi:DUF3857 domain-containing protein [Tenacibaculum ovolyticum]|uniref:DUF3857 domain-containing protein n=1 Tax=Tenacibaculum ovolyticum TaxID=104270 RepID=UPI0007EC667F|nr:DUF3857 domain-containing protein [Tenacibaculum ovolyticum]WBX76254.1 DUF3857 domain-containing protein [Tenacibaculum ovolyticum]
MKNINFIIITLLFLVKTNAQEIKFGKVSKAALEEEFYPLDSTADAAYLLKKRKTYFEFSASDGFTVVTKYHERIKIYTKEGFKYATKQIRYYKPESGDQEKVKSIKAYTFSIEDGKIIKQKLSKKDIFNEQISKFTSQKKLTLPNIKKGTVIDIEYTLTSPYYDIETLNFQYSIPVKQLNYKIEVPEYFVFNKRSKGYYSITPKKSKKNKVITLNSKSRTGRRTTRTNFYSSKVNYFSNIDLYSGNNIPAIKEDEPFVFNISNYRGGIKYELSMTDFLKTGGRTKYYSTTWENVCKTIYKSSNFGSQLDKSSYYKEDLSILLKPTKNDSEKIAAILNYVKSNVKWNEYIGKFTDKGVKKAYKEKSGNTAEINLMLTSMLRFAGINANPVLVSTKNNGIPLFPTRKGYNYVISKVNFSDGKYILLDATEKYSLPNILPYKVLNWYGREILKNGTSKTVNLIPLNHTKENNTLYLSVDETGTAEGVLRKSFTGHSALFYRKKNNIKKEEDIITSLEEQYNVEIEDFKILNKEELSKPILQTLKFTGDDFIEEINNKLYFSPLFFLAKKENPFKSKERNFPVDYVMPWKDTFSVVVTIPENYTVESLPENLAIGLPENAGVFKYQITFAGNKVKLSAVLQINTSIITPEHYTVLKEFYSQLVKKQTEKIVLIKK